MRCLKNKHCNSVLNIFSDIPAFPCHFLDQISPVICYPCNNVHLRRLTTGIKNVVLIFPLKKPHTNYLPQVHSVLQGCTRKDMINFVVKE